MELGKGLGRYTGNGLEASLWAGLFPGLVLDLEERFSEGLDERLWAGIVFGLQRVPENTVQNRLKQALEERRA